MKKITVFLVQGYKKMLPDGNTASDVAHIEVVAENEAEAIVEAKKLVKKKNYRVSDVYVRFADI